MPNLPSKSGTPDKLSDSSVSCRGELRLPVEQRVVSQPSKAESEAQQWRGKALPLNRVVLLVYAPPRSSVGVADADALVDQTLLFSLLTLSGRTFCFAARNHADLRAWVLSLSRVLRARGGFCRTRTPLELVVRLVQVRVEAQAQAFGLSAGQVWMIALRRAAGDLGLPLHEYSGKQGTCIATRANLRFKRAEGDNER